jgi:hypothetical protein
LEINLQKLPLTNLRILQPDARALVFVLKAKAMLVGGHQIVFVGCFKNTNAGHMVIRLADDIGHIFGFKAHSIT